MNLKFFDICSLEPPATITNYLDVGINQGVKFKVLLICHNFR